MSVPHVLATVLCVVALVWPGLSAASYLIQLRNGRHIATSQYWKEGQTIMFSTAGGVGGVPESAVLQIQTVEDPPASALTGATEPHVAPHATRQGVPPAEPKALPPAAPHALPPAAPHALPPAAPHALPPAAGPREGGKLSQRDLEAYWHKKEELKAQLDLAVERYREASSAHSPEDKAKIQREITTWSKQLFDLRDEVKQKNQGHLPEGWETF
jgi:hypothetical protein